MSPFWKKDEVDEFKKSNPELTEGLTDKQVADLAESERTEQEWELGNDDA